VSIAPDPVVVAAINRKGGRWQMWGIAKNFIKVLVFIYGGMLLFFAVAALILNLQFGESDAQGADHPPTIDHGDREG
jgi:O-antigen/teichoic acid export membrane protein